MLGICATGTTPTPIMPLTLTDSGLVCRDAFVGYLNATS